MGNEDFNELTPNEIDEKLIGEISVKAYEKLWRMEWQLTEAMTHLFNTYMEMTSSKIAADKLMQLHLDTVLAGLRK